MRNQSKNLQGKKLSLSKETLRQLRGEELNEVAGGGRTNRCPGTAAPTEGCTSGTSWPCPR